MRQHASTSEGSREGARSSRNGRGVPPLWLLASLCFATSVPAAPSAPSAADQEFFESKVRPLLVEHCASCHSHEAGEPEGGLSFDSRADFL
ncbi:MAG: hypothetical protein RLZZ111_591, partial [Planctomycetota bacterium]